VKTDFDVLILPVSVIAVEGIVRLKDSERGFDFGTFTSPQVLFRGSFSFHTFFLFVNFVC
jgi:hypothetical protein